MKANRSTILLCLLAVALLAATPTTYDYLKSNYTTVVGTALTVGTTATVTGNINANGNIVGDGATVLSGIASGTVTTSTATTLHVTTLDVNGASTVDGGLLNIGGGTYTVANGDNDVGIDGDLEINGNIQADGNITGDGATVVYGMVRSVSDIAGTDSKALAASQSGKTFTNNGNTGGVNVVLPAAAAGIEYTFGLVAAATVSIDCNAADRIAGRLLARL